MLQGNHSDALCASGDNSDDYLGDIEIVQKCLLSRSIFDPCGSSSEISSAITSIDLQAIPS